MKGWFHVVETSLSCIHRKAVMNIVKCVSPGKKIINFASDTEKHNISPQV